MKPKEYIQKAVEWKAAEQGNAGELTAWASVFERGTDLYGDIISRGAFTKTIKERVEKGWVPLLASHEDGVIETIGKVIAAKETEYGLMFTAVFSADEFAQRCRAKCLEGILTGFSIGFIPIRSHYDKIGDETVQYLDEIKLLEISLCAIPAREDARLISVKSFDSKQQAGSAPTIEHGQGVTTAGTKDTTAPQGAAGPDGTTASDRMAKQREELQRLQANYITRRLHHDLPGTEGGR